MQWSRTIARSSAVLVLGLAGTLAALALGSGKAESAVSGAFAGRVGLNSHLVWISEGEAKPQYEQAAAGGISWVREEFPWRIVEPQRGVFDWRNTDGMMAATAAAGVNVLGIMGYSAGWAASGPDTSYPPTDPADYANYVRAVLLRYGAGGTFWETRPDLTPRPLTAIELWNEPWGYWAWKPNPDPVAYSRLARAAIAAVRAVRPETKILISGDYWQTRTSGAAREWLRELRAADPGLSGLADAYSMHPYPDPRTMGPLNESGDARFTFAGQIRLAREIDSTIPMWITEVGWSTAATSDSVSETTQAAFVADAVRRSVDEWGSFVERIFLYTWTKDTTDADRESHYGLRRADSSAKPAWTTLVGLLSSDAGGTPTDGTTTTSPTSTQTTTSTTTSAPPPATSPSKPKPPKARRTTASSRSLNLHARFVRLPSGTPAPKPLPSWFWTWGRWQLGHGEYRARGTANTAFRPARAPKQIPRWAWDKLRVASGAKPVGRQAFAITLQGRLTVPQGKRVTSSARTARRTVTAYRRGPHGWIKLGQARLSKHGRFRLSTRIAGTPRLITVRAVAQLGSSRVVSPVRQVLTGRS